jgi:hypothetical protein
VIFIKLLLFIKRLVSKKSGGDKKQNKWRTIFFLVLYLYGFIGFIFGVATTLLMHQWFPSLSLFQSNSFSLFVAYCIGSIEVSSGLAVWYYLRRR